MTFVFKYLLTYVFNHDIEFEVQIFDCTNMKLSILPKYDNRFFSEESNPATHTCIWFYCVCKDFYNIGMETRTHHTNFNTGLTSLFRPLSYVPKRFVYLYCTKWTYFPGNRCLRTEMVLNLVDSKNKFI